MKKLNVCSLALTYAGSFLGAGFVSGQEIWQFFGMFGLGGWAGLVLTIALLIILGIVIMLLVDRTGIFEMDRLMVPWNIPWLRFLSAALQIIFYFGVIAIMYAGGGALFSQLFDLPSPIGSAAICILVTIVAIYGATGIVRVYSFIVPAMVVLAVVTGLLGLIRFGIVPGQTLDGSNPLLGGWLVSSVNYAAYNGLVTVGILATVAEIPHTRKVTVRGITLGGVLLLFVAVSVLGGIASCPESAGSELPMLYLASEIFTPLGYAYGVLLLLAMYGSALSSVVAVMNYAYIKYPKTRGKSIPILIVLGALCYCTSLGGFGDLISVIYPLFGYASIIFMLCLFLHFRQTKESVN